MLRTKLSWIYHPVFIISLCWSCNWYPDAQTIVDRSRKAHGVDLIDHSRIEFIFRNRTYISEREGGLFSYHRIFTDSLDTYHDVLTNVAFSRQLNDQHIDVTEERANAYSNSINSVIYFALLPYSLNEPAVIKEYIGHTEIKGIPYYKIKVTFKKDGGGEDHDDEFVFWIRKKEYTMDYMAYTYYSDGGGTRFRKAINQRVVKGIRFSDYINMKPKNTKFVLEDLDQDLVNGHLEKLSDIFLEGIKVVLN